MTGTTPTPTPTPAPAPASNPVRAVFRDLLAIDGAVYAAVAATPTPTLDTGLRRLSRAANHSKISFAVAAGLALVPGRPRRDRKSVV